MSIKEYLEWLNEDGDFINLRRLVQIALDEKYRELKGFDYPKIDARIVLDYFKKHSKTYTFAGIKNSGGLGFFETSFRSFMEENLPRLIDDNN